MRTPTLTRTIALGTMKQDLLSDLARTLPRAEFAAKFPHLFFVFRHDTSASHPLPAFHTELADPDSSRWAVAGSMTVQAVVKSSHNPYSDRISIGRARNCDVVLRETSVSKLHAHVRRANDGQWVLTDASSQNGTAVNGTKLLANQSIPLVTGYVVVFGSLLTRVVDGNDLHGVLLRLAASTPT